MRIGFTKGKDKAGFTSLRIIWESSCLALLTMAVESSPDLFMMEGGDKIEISKERKGRKKEEKKKKRK